MDVSRFDSLTRRLAAGTDRRTALRLAGVSLLATVGTTVGLRSDTAAQLDADACVPNGNRCGKKGQPKCAKCCTRFTVRQPITRQRRCTCKAEFRQCRRPDQCCSGNCIRVPCLEPPDPTKKYCIPGILGPDPCSES
jgi:hypothetical protein